MSHQNPYLPLSYIAPPCFKPGHVPRLQRGHKQSGVLSTQGHHPLPRLRSLEVGFLKLVSAWWQLRQAWPIRTVFPSHTDCFRDGTHPLQNKWGKRLSSCHEGCQAREQGGKLQGGKLMPHSERECLRVKPTLRKTGAGDIARVGGCLPNMYQSQGSISCIRNIGLGGTSLGSRDRKAGG